MLRPDLLSLELDMMVRALKLSGTVFASHPPLAALISLGRATIRCLLSYQFISGIRNQPAGFSPLPLDAGDGEWRRAIHDAGLDEEIVGFYCELEQQAPIRPLIASLRQKCGYFIANETVYAAKLGPDRHRDSVELVKGRLVSPQKEEQMTDGSNWWLETAGGEKLAVTGRLIFKPWELYCLRHDSDYLSEEIWHGGYPLAELLKVAAAQVALHKHTPRKSETCN